MDTPKNTGGNQTGNRRYTRRPSLTLRHLSSLHSSDGELVPPAWAGSKLDETPGSAENLMTFDRYYGWATTILNNMPRNKDTSVTREWLDFIHKHRKEPVMYDFVRLFVFSLHLRYRVKPFDEKPSDKLLKHPRFDVVNAGRVLTWRLAALEQSMSNDEDLAWNIQLRDRHYNKDAFCICGKSDKPYNFFPRIHISHYRGTKEYFATQEIPKFGRQCWYTVTTDEFPYEYEYENPHNHKQRRNRKDLLGRLADHLHNMELIEQRPIIQRDVERFRLTTRDWWKRQDRSESSEGESSSEDEEFRWHKDSIFTKGFKLDPFMKWLLLRTMVREEQDTQSSKSPTRPSPSTQDDIECKPTSTEQAGPSEVISSELQMGDKDRSDISPLELQQMDFELENARGSASSLGPERTDPSLIERVRVALEEGLNKTHIHMHSDSTSSSSTSSTSAQPKSVCPRTRTPSPCPRTSTTPPCPRSRTPPPCPRARTPSPCPRRMTPSPPPWTTATSPQPWTTPTSPPSWTTATSPQPWTTPTSPKPWTSSPLPSPRKRTPFPCPRTSTTPPCPRPSTPQPCPRPRTPSPCPRTMTPPPCPRTRTPSPCPRRMILSPRPWTTATSPQPWTTPTSPPSWTTATSPQPWTTPTSPPAWTSSPQPSPRKRTPFPCPRTSTYSPSPRARTPSPCPRTTTPSPCPRRRTPSPCPRTPSPRPWTTPTSPPSWTTATSPQPWASSPLPCPRTSSPAQRLSVNTPVFDTKSNIYSQDITFAREVAERIGDPFGPPEVVNAAISSWMNELQSSFGEFPCVQEQAQTSKTPRPSFPPQGFEDTCSKFPSPSGPESAAPFESGSDSLDFENAKELSFVDQFILPTADIEFDEDAQFAADPFGGFDDEPDDDWVAPPEVVPSEAPCLVPSSSDPEETEDRRAGKLFLPPPQRSQTPAELEVIDWPDRTHLHDINTDFPETDKPFDFLGECMLGEDDMGEISRQIPQVQDKWLNLADIADQIGQKFG